jgi:hypothetical protein
MVIFSPWLSTQGAGAPFLSSQRQPFVRLFVAQNYQEYKSFYDYHQNSAIAVILEKRHGLDEASHSRASPKTGNYGISRTPGFLPSQDDKKCIYSQG